MRVIIVDDEALARANLRYALADHPDWQVAGEFDAASAARAFLAQHDVDLVFLDIHMPGEHGLVLARALSRLPQPPLIVFVTAYDQHAIEAFEVHALDYLLKPLDDARLAAALARAGAMLAQRQRAVHADAVRAFVGEIDPAGAPAPFWSRIHVRSVGRIDHVALDDVLWIASAGNYVELHLRERTILYRIPISRLERHLDPRDFVRTHRRFIVRAAQCATLAGPVDAAWMLTLRCGAAVPVSEQCVTQVRARMTTY